MLPGGVVPASFFARLRAAASCFLTAFLSCLAVGTRAWRPLTTTRPIMPGWTSQKYLTVPVFANLTVIGLGWAANGRPDWTRLLPFRVTVLPSEPWSTDGLNWKFAWPLNQNGAPAASLTPVIWPAGVNSGSAVPPLGGISTVWKPTGLNRTLPPALIVTLLGKNALTSDEYLFWNSPWAFAGRPMSTLLVFAWAEATGMVTIATAARTAADLAKTRTDLSFRSARPPAEHAWGEPNRASWAMQAGGTDNPCSLVRATPAVGRGTPLAAGSGPGET